MTDSINTPKIVALMRRIEEIKQEIETLIKERDEARKSCQEAVDYGAEAYTKLEAVRKDLDMRIKQAQVLSQHAEMIENAFAKRTEVMASEIKKLGQLTHKAGEFTLRRVDIVRDGEWKGRLLMDYTSTDATVTIWPETKSATVWIGSAFSREQGKDLWKLLGKAKDSPGEHPYETIESLLATVDRAAKAAKESKP